MVRKSDTGRNGASGKARVTFEMPPAVGAEQSVEIAGDFTDWEAKPLTRRKDGRYSLTLTLEKGRSYRYRYLIDGDRWENDWEADEYVPNQFGGDDSVVHL